MTNKDIFEVTSKSEMTKILSDFLPSGRVWDKKNNPESNIYKLLASLAFVYQAVQESIQWLINETNVKTTTDLLSNWERSVGLPDDCVSTDRTLDQRREAVVSRLRKVPFVDKGQILTLLQALFTEFGINIYAGADVVPTPTKEDRFTLVLGLQVVEGEEFEYDLELDLVPGFQVNRLICILRDLVPANVYITTRFE